MPEHTMGQIKFEHIYIQYRNLMYRTANDVLHNSSDAEDAVQQSFVNILENIQQIETDSEPRLRSFVVKVARNCAIDILRKKRHMCQIQLEKAAESTVCGLGDIIICIQQLPEQYQKVLLLKSLYGYSSGETAEILKISEANVIKIHQRAKKKLRQLL